MCDVGCVSVCVTVCIAHLLSPPPTWDPIAAKLASPLHLECSDQEWPQTSGAGLILCRLGVSVSGDSADHQEAPPRMVADSHQGQPGG